MVTKERTLNKDKAQLISEPPSLFGRSRDRFPGVSSNPSSDFFPFRVALSSFKYPYNAVLMERGGKNERIVGLNTSTESGLYAHLSGDFEQTFGQSVSIRVKNLSHTHLVVSKHYKRGKKTSFRLTCSAQKRCCLSSLLL